MEVEIRLEHDRYERLLREYDFDPRTLLGAEDESG
jgi:hypothetical protein